MRFEDMPQDLLDLFNTLPGKQRDFVRNFIGNYTEAEVRDAFTRGSMAPRPGMIGEIRLDLNPGRAKEDELRRDIVADSESFRDQIPDIQSQEKKYMEKQAAGLLHSGQRNIRLNAARRGLLNSGLRLAAEQGLRSKVSGGLAESMVNLNRDLEKTARAKEKAAASVGLDRYQQDIASAEKEYDRMLTEKQRRRESMGALTQGIGYGLGAYYGYGGGANQQNQNAPLAAPQLKPVKGFISQPSGSGYGGGGGSPSNFGGSKFGDYYDPIRNY